MILPITAPVRWVLQRQLGVTDTVRTAPRQTLTFGSAGGDAAQSFTLLSWNILAQSLCKGGLRDPQCALQHIAWSYRRDLVANFLTGELRDAAVWTAGAGADVLALQEVDADRVGDLLAAVNAASRERYAVEYAKRDSWLSADGCATLWDTSRFRRVDAFRVLLDRGQPAGVGRVALVVVLERVGARRPYRVCVANCHLDSRFRHGALRRAEAERLMHELARRVEWALPDGTRTALVVCGDLNTMDHPPVPVLEYLLRGGGGAPYRLASAYAARPLARTLRNNGFHGGRWATYGDVLDHIIHSSSAGGGGAAGGPLPLRSTAVLRGLAEDDAGEELAPRVAFPNAQHPSDHIPLAARLTVQW